MAVATVATYSGRGIIWQRMKGAGAEAKNIGWGTSNVTVTGSASQNVNMFAPATEARTAGTSSVISTSSLGDTYQITGTITCATTGKTIQEAALFDAITPLSPTTTLSASLATTTAGTSMNGTFGTSLVGAVGSYYAQVGTETILVSGAASTTLAIVRGVLASTIGVWAVGTPVTFGGDGGSGESLGGTWTTLQTVNPNSIAASYGGNVFIHADFAGIALNVNDSISFTFSDTLT